MQNHRNPPAYPIASVDNALKLLAMLANEGDLRVAEAAATLGTARSTAHRLLAMLEYHGLATQDDATKTYAAGPALITLGLAAVGHLDLRHRARPVLERLCAELEETVHLARRDEASIVFLDAVETTKALRVASRVGRVMPAHCTAAGKAMLAELSDQELRELYPDQKLIRMTPGSIRTFKELERELNAVRERGYATNFGESEEDVASVAVAVPSKTSRGLAAITVSAPVTRLDEAHVFSIAAATQREAAALSVPDPP